MRLVYRSFVTLLAALLLCALPLAAQHRMRMSAADTTVYTVTAPGGVPEIPFELLNNQLSRPL